MGLAGGNDVGCRSCAIGAKALFHKGTVNVVNVVNVVLRIEYYTV